MNEIQENIDFILKRLLIKIQSTNLQPSDNVMLQACEVAAIVGAIQDISFRLTLIEGNIKGI